MTFFGNTGLLTTIFGIPFPQGKGYKWLVTVSACSIHIVRPSTARRNVSRRSVYGARPSAHVSESSYKRTKQNRPTTEQDKTEHANCGVLNGMCVELCVLICVYQSGFCVVGVWSVFVLGWAVVWRGRFWWDRSVCWCSWGRTGSLFVSAPISCVCLGFFPFLPSVLLSCVCSVSF